MSRQFGFSARCFLGRDCSICGRTLFRESKASTSSTGTKDAASRNYGSATLTDRELRRKPARGGARQCSMEGIQYPASDPKEVPADTFIDFVREKNEMSFVTRRLAAFSTAVILLASAGSSALAQKQYDPGVTD